MGGWLRFAPDDQRDCVTQKPRSYSRGVCQEHQKHQIKTCGKQKQPPFPSGVSGTFQVHSRMYEVLTARRGRDRSGELRCSSSVCLSVCLYVCVCCMNVCVYECVCVCVS